MLHCSWSGLHWNFRRLWLCHFFWKFLKYAIFVAKRANTRCFWTNNFGLRALRICLLAFLRLEKRPHFNYAWLIFHQILRQHPILSESSPKILFAIIIYFSWQLNSCQAWTSIMSFAVVILFSFLPNKLPQQQKDSQIGSQNHDFWC